MKWYIKERHNPQFKHPSYSLLGKISAKKAKQHEKTLYGDNYMLPFDTEDEYLAYSEKLKKDGKVVHNN